MGSEIIPAQIWIGQEVGGGRALSAPLGYLPVVLYLYYVQTEQGEVALVHVWKTLGVAVRSITNIYSLVASVTVSASK